MMRAVILAVSAVLATPLGFAAPVEADPVTITGMTWLDENFDGIRQDTEGALWKWHVRVENAEGGGVVTEGQTGVGGRYSFTGLPPGKYKVVMGATPERWPTLANIGDDDRDSDIDQTQGSSQVLDCTGGPCGVVDGGFVDPHLDVALTAAPSRITIPPRGRATVRVDVTNTGNQPWQAPVYLPPQGVKVENPRGNRWYCNTADPQRPNCTPIGGALMPGERQSLWFDISATDASTGNVNVSVLKEYDENPDNNHGFVGVTVG